MDILHVLLTATPTKPRPSPGTTPYERMDTLASILAVHGRQFGLDKRHRLAHFLAQCAHESAWFRLYEELWGPTQAQVHYEGRDDLGNTEPGDGYKYRGRGAIQITGRSNYRQFTEWMRAWIDPAAPDFVTMPHLVSQAEWGGYTAIWYWTTRELNTHADKNDMEMLTRRINGGMNGFADRSDNYGHIVCAILHRGSIEEFQRYAKLDVDGIIGPQTRAAMHRALTSGCKGTSASPVVETQREAAVPPELEKPMRKQRAVWERVATAGTAAGGTLLARLTNDPTVLIITIIAVVVIAGIGLWQHQRIINAIKALKAEIA